MERKKDAVLAVVDDGQRPGGGDELAHLRRWLAEQGVPEQVLQALEDASDPKEILHRLVQAGLVPSPEQSLAGLLEGFKPLPKRAVTR